MTVPKVKEKKCVGCGICVSFCPADALRGWGIIEVDGERCTGCSECLDACPVEALEA
jgi:ferredoxin